MDIRDLRKSFASERTACVSSRSFTVTNKSNSLTYTVASSLVCTSPVAVITVVGFSDILVVSNSAEFRYVLLTIRTMRCGFFCLHFAVGCDNRRRTFRDPYGFQFGTVQVFPAQHVH